MSTPPAFQTTAASTAAQVALVDAANALFIKNADLAIADKKSQGLYLVRLSLYEHVNLQYIVTYYQNFGYVVGAPLPSTIGNQPSDLFGSFWQDYWQNTTFFFAIYGFGQPTEIFISWAPITLPFPPNNTGVDYV